MDAVDRSELSTARSLTVRPSDRTTGRPRTTSTVTSSARSEHRSPAGVVGNVDLVGTLKLTNQVGDISDVSALQAEDGGWYAYLGDWGAKCQTGGVHVVNFATPPTRSSSAS